MHDKRQYSPCLASAWSRARPCCGTPAYRRQAEPLAVTGSALSRTIDGSTHVKVHHLEHSQLCPRVPESVVILDERVSFRCRVDGLDVDDGYARGLEDVAAILSEVGRGHDDQRVLGAHGFQAGVQDDYTCGAKVEHGVKVELDSDLP
jgi:hypothetical protein